MFQHLIPCLLCTSPCWSLTLHFVVLLSSTVQSSGAGKFQSIRSSEHLRCWLPSFLPSFLPRSWWFHLFIARPIGVVKVMPRRGGRGWSRGGRGLEFSSLFVVLPPSLPPSLSMPDTLIDWPSQQIRGCGWKTSSGSVEGFSSITCPSFPFVRSPV